MEIQASLINNNSYDNQLIQGKSTEKLFLHLDRMLDKDGELELKKSSYDILKQCVPANTSNENKHENNTGLVIGYVQSGKTMSFTAAIALAQDNGYRIVIIISGRQKLLLKQTTKRLKQDFKNNSDIIVKEVAPKSNNLDINRISKNLRKGKTQTTIITILKDHRWIYPLAKIFKDDAIKEELKKNTILIIDDEADSASLNTKVKQNKKQGLDNSSATYASIVRLRNVFYKHTYLQYTATPQGPLLINYVNILSPDWAVVLKPGNGYVGGQVYFQENSKYIKHIPYEGINKGYPPDIDDLESAPQSLITAIREFIIMSSLICYPDISNNIINENSSMMIHPTYIVKSDKLENGIARWFDWTKNIVDDIESDLDYGDYETLEKTYNELKNSESLRNKILLDFKSIIKNIEEVIYKLKVWQVVGSGSGSNLEDGNIEWEDYKHHILVGGQLLDRGFTVEDLVLTYMPRNTKSLNQADTIEQRCRFFGYKKHYLDFCRVYLPSAMISDYKSYVEHEENIHNILKEMPLSEFKKIGSRMFLDNNLIATNMSRIDEDIINNTLSGFRYFEPTFPTEQQNNELIKQFIKNLPDNRVTLEPSIEKHRILSRRHYVNKISSDNILQLIRNFDVGISATDALKKAHIIQYLESIGIEEELWLIQIAPVDTKKRERTIKINIDNIDRGKNIFSISELAFGGMFSNTKAKGRYYGDRDLIIRDANPEIQYNNELIVQIHEIKVLTKETKKEIDNAIQTLNNKDEKSENHHFILEELKEFKKEINHKTFYTLALNFPESYKTRYIQKLQSHE